MSDREDQQVRRPADDGWRGGRTGSRVLMLTDSLGVGGLERVVVLLANELAERGHHVGVAAEAGGDLWDDLAPAVARCHPPRRVGGITTPIRYIRWLHRVVREGAWDIIHAHQRRVSLFARVAVAGSRCRVVEHVHNTFSPAQPVSRLVSFRGHHLVACGSSVASMLEHDFGRPRERISVIPNAVHDLGADTALELPSSSGRPPHILAIGRLVPEKDPLRFVEIIRSLVDAGLDVTAEWVGAGELHTEVTEKIRCEVPDRVRLTGQTRDVPGRIRAADLLLLSSRREGLPLVTLEALSLGRGIVAPDVGSCSDVVEQNGNGLLYPVDLSADEVATLLAAPMRRRELAAWGRRSRSKFVDGWTVASMLSDVEDVYRSTARLSG